jgi:cytochrome c oxidase assembly factor CtaG
MRAFLTLLGTNLASLVLITFAVLAIAGAVTLNKDIWHCWASGFVIYWLGGCASLREFGRKGRGE